MSDTKPVAVKNRDLNNLVRALSGLDGFHEKAGDSVIAKPYKISGKVRLRLAKWLTSAVAASKDLSDTHDKLVKQYIAESESTKEAAEGGASQEIPDAPKAPKAPKGTQVPTDRIAEFNEEWAGVLDEVTEFPHAKVKATDLLGENEVNAIPVTVLAGLDPILED
jgi:hypothetical protein